MSATDLAGWLAAGLTICSFACRDMLALRMLAERELTIDMLEESSSRR